MRDRDVPPSARSTSVKDDWEAWLPEEKLSIFQKHSQQLESDYSMLSISLNEAIELRDSGHRQKALQAVSVTPDLCWRLVDQVEALLLSLGEHAKHYGIVPNTSPLNPANFQGSRGQGKARISGILSHIVLTNRSQFLQKIETLKDMVSSIGQDFCTPAEILGEGTAIHPDSLWKTVDANHYDVNTCLRESIVLLKSFLLAMPAAQLSNFQNTLNAQSLAAHAKSRDRQGSVRHSPRRMSPIAGE